MGRRLAHTPGLGLRERKKLLTRQAITDTAHAMFLERGYDNVTVAEIADAANVSANTVFGYFPSKEDLVFDDSAEVREALVERIRHRPPGETPLRTMVAVMREMICVSGSSAVTDLDRLHRMVGTSVTLQSRLARMWEQFEESLAEALAEEFGEGPHSPRPSVLAAQLILVFRMMASERFLGYLRAHTEPAQPAALEEWLSVTIELIGQGIADYAPRRG